jgi:hypothetical protein
MSSKRATLWIDPESRRIAVRTPYDSVFIEAFKKAIPWQCRSWNAIKKVWLVDIASKGSLEELLTKSGYELSDGTMQHEEVQVASNGSPYHELIAHLPWPVLCKIFRVIVVECHPDRGGDTKTMALANVAWENINKERENMEGT